MASSSATNMPSLMVRPPGTAILITTDLYINGILFLYCILYLMFTVFGR